MVFAYSAQAVTYIINQSALPKEVKHVIEGGYFR